MSDSGRARFAGHTKRAVVCDCGRTLTGNGRTAHQRACEPYLRAHGYPLADGTVDGIRGTLHDARPRLEVPNGRGGWRSVAASDLLPAIRRTIADAVLARRAAGNRRPLDRVELLELLWPAYDAALAEVMLAHNGRRRH